MSIRIDGLRVCYRRHVALEGVNLTAMPGEILGIIGPNGSGKSSLVKAVAGILPYSGTVHFDVGDGKPPTIGYMPQDHAARAALSVLETVLLGRLGRLGLRVSREDMDAVERVLTDIGILHLASRDLGALSGGQRQLVFLAQAMASGPSALLLDEPFSALDIRHQLEVAELLVRLTREQHLVVVIVLHDLLMAGRFADQIALIQGGRLIAHGPPKAILTGPSVKQAFHVDFDILVDEADRAEIRNLRLPGMENPRAIHAQAVEQDMNCPGNSR